MGTRSLTRVFDGDDKKELVCIYRQFDGYPDGMGKDLADFLTPFTIVNGIGMEDARRIANGVGCLAAQLIHHLKGASGVGGIYLEPVGTVGAGEEYEYHIHAAAPAAFGSDPAKPIELTCMSVGHTYNSDYSKRTSTKRKTLFKGPVADFTAWLAAHHDEDA